MLNKSDLHTRTRNAKRETKRKHELIAIFKQKEKMKERKSPLIFNF